VAGSTPNCCCKLRVWGGCGEGWVGCVWNVSAFMHGVKQRFTQWYNGRKGRKGTLWEDRFKSGGGRYGPGAGGDGGVYRSEPGAGRDGAGPQRLPVERL
jgi:hypothetical protein